MSNVWLAEHTLLDRRVAIKVLRSELSNRPEIVAQFVHEARITTAIANPGIVQVFDLGFHIDGSAYIVMELLEGETLERRLARSGVIAIASALHVVRQVTTALEVAHARGVVHRDLKPDNIFLVHDPEVAGGERAKILDFGIAMRLGDGMRVQEPGVLGTPAFMSPEQCRGSRDIDQQSDIYSLGCMLFALVTGRPPFDAAETGAVMAMHLREPVPVPSRHATGLPSAVDHLVRRCMAKDPEQRFTAGALASAIDALFQAPEVAGAFGRASASPSEERCMDMMETLPGVSESAATLRSRRPAVAAGLVAIA
jgi:serine/threonine-protein kinase